MWQRRPKIAPDAKPSAGWSLRELQVVVGLDLELPRQLGATDTMNSTSADMVAAVRALTNGDGVDYAFEVIGRAGTTKACSFRMLRRGGPAVAVGIAPAGALVATEPASLCTRRRPSRGATTAGPDLTRASGRSWSCTCVGSYYSTCSSAGGVGSRRSTKHSRRWTRDGRPLSRRDES